MDMRSKMVGKCLIAVLLTVLLLMNAVNAQPPIGLQEVEFSPSATITPGDEVTVTITWWIVNNVYIDYTGPFCLKICLKDPVTEYEPPDWTMYIEKDFTDFESPSPLNPFSHTFTKSAPDVCGEYNLEVQILACSDETSREVGNSGNTHYLLVASGEDAVTTVPEFTTIAIPVVAILGLLFVFNHRKHRK
jgi:hypothetical protein